MSGEPGKELTCTVCQHVFAGDELLAAFQHHADCMQRAVSELKQQIAVLQESNKQQQKQISALEANQQRGALGSFKDGFVYLGSDTMICWRNKSDADADDDDDDVNTPWNPLQNPQQADAIKTVGMNGCGIKREDVVVLCQYLLNCPNITNLALASNNLEDQGMNHVAAILPTLPNLTHLYLQGNNITAKGALRAALPSLTQLELLDLSDNSLGDEGVRTFVGILAGMPSLKIVNLVGNGASDQTVETARSTLSFLGYLSI